MNTRPMMRMAGDLLHRLPAPRFSKPGLDFLFFHAVTATGIMRKPDQGCFPIRLMT